MIGKNIQELRIKNNLTQKELANAIGVTSSAVGHWEIEKKSPSHKMVLKLADFFNISIDRLYGKEMAEECVLSIIGKNGTVKKYKMSEEKLKAFELMAESAQDGDDNNLDKFD